MKTKEIDERFDEKFNCAGLLSCQMLPLEVKKFIHTELQSVLEEVSNGLPEDKRRSTRVRQDLTDFEEGFNDCLDQVTSLINNLIEEKND